MNLAVKYASRVININMLINNGWDLNIAKDIYEITALHYATFKSSPLAIRIMLPELSIDWSKI